MKLARRTRLEDCRFMLVMELWLDGCFLPFRHSLTRIFGSKWPRFISGGSSGSSDSSYCIWPIRPGGTETMDSHFDQSLSSQVLVDGSHAWRKEARMAMIRPSSRTAR